MTFFVGSLVYTLFVEYKYKCYKNNIATDLSSILFTLVFNHVALSEDEAFPR